MNRLDDIVELDPCTDGRWDLFVSRHPRASIFHRTAWLDALRQTYGYRTAAYGRVSVSGELLGGILLSEVKSWLTGRRMVSLPFADHCEPLVDDSEELRALLAQVMKERDRRRWRYIEIRPLTTRFSDTAGSPSRKFVLHRLDLSATMEELFRKLHVDSIRRKIQKAGKSGLMVRSGRASDLLADFYRLHVHTRKRQLSPPHPFVWFRNVVKCLGESACIRVAYKDDIAAASVFTLETGTTVVYKYGCSDERFHSLGAMPFVFWDMIQSAKVAGKRELDLGRSDLDNPGLIAFKEKWGAQGQPLIYSRTPAVDTVLERGAKSVSSLKGFIRHCPDWLLISAGRLLYPHLG